MKYRLLVAHALAKAFCVGPWKPAELRRLAANVVGADASWITPVVRTVLRHFPEPPTGDEGIARLARVVASNRAFHGAFWGREVPRIRHWLALPPTMEATPWPVPPAATLVELGRVLEVEPRELQWLADPRRYLGRNKSPRLEHYHRTWLPKRRGGYRLIEVPKARIKAIQRRVLRCILDAIPTHPCAEGFVRGRSALSHALRHTGRAAVLCLDLEDFFTSIPHGRVFHVFRAAGYPAPVARVLAGVCTTAVPPADFARCPRPDHEGELARYQRLRQSALSQHLPQGAPTSPALANLCAFGLDRRLAGAAAAVGAKYSRYADDLTFSGDAAFARRVREFSTFAAAIALDEGFEVNFRKTRIMQRASRQLVCGLVVNERPNLPRRDLDRLKAILTNCLRHGVDSQNIQQHADFRAHLQGRVAWVESVAPPQGAKLRALFERISWAAAGE
jgi:hypothetical protein